jgi:hypothetical protein
VKCGRGGETAPRATHSMRAEKRRRREKSERMRRSNVRATSSPPPCAPAARAAGKRIGERTEGATHVLGDARGVAARAAPTRTRWVEKWCWCLEKDGGRTPRHNPLSNLHALRAGAGLLLPQLPPPLLSSHSRTGQPRRAARRTCRSAATWTPRSGARRLTRAMPARARLRLRLLPLPGALARVGLEVAVTLRNHMIHSDQSTPIFPGMTQDDDLRTDWKVPGHFMHWMWRTGLRRAAAGKS